MARIEILHEPTAAEPFLVLDKPAGLATAPLFDGDESALTQAVALFPSLADVTGRKPIERGLLHRLDTATRGCVLVAATQDAYDALFAAQKAGACTKWYTALVDCMKDAPALLGGFPPAPVDADAVVARAQMLQADAGDVAGMATGRMVVNGADAADTPQTPIPQTLANSAATKTMQAPIERVLVNGADAANAPQKPIQQTLANSAATKTMQAPTQPLVDAARTTTTSPLTNACAAASTRTQPQQPPLASPATGADHLLATPSFVVESRFRAYGLHGAAVRPVAQGAGRAALKKAAGALYRTQVRLLPSSAAASRAKALFSEAGTNGMVAECVITAGYRHQVRCHLAWCGFPVRGDGLYHPRYAHDATGAALCFAATRLRFPNPVTGEWCEFSLQAVPPS